MEDYRRLSSRQAVIEAIYEFDELGRDGFLEKYGYGKARRFMLLHDGKQYDSKAIVGSAYYHQFGRLLKNTEFSGGQASVVPKLESLGFQVVALSISDNTTALAEEVPQSIWEGGKRTVSVNAYERSPEARAKCIEIHGSVCAICSFDFSEFYGQEFKGFIHVHHLIPLSEMNERYQVNPAEDLVPLCPNCHAVVHYGNKLRTIEEVKKLIKNQHSAGNGRK